jgi:hypothetical protein
MVESVSLGDELLCGLFRPEKSGRKGRIFTGQNRGNTPTKHSLLVLPHRGTNHRFLMIDTKATVMPLSTQ